MTSVSLFAGNSIFADFSANQVNQGSSPRLAFFGIDTGGPPVSLAPSSTTLLGRFTFDTSGLNLNEGPWNLSLSNVGPSGTDTEYVLVGGQPKSVDTIINGSLALVPEPEQALMTTVLLLGMALLAHRKRLARCGKIS